MPGARHLERYGRAGQLRPQASPLPISISSVAYDPAIEIGRLLRAPNNTSGL